MPPRSSELPRIILDEEMVTSASEMVSSTKIDRTQASLIDTLSGNLGELAFAHFFYGDWRKNRVGQNAGQTDFPEIEIKTSAFPFRMSLNLLVRKEYAAKRKPRAYVQVIIDVPDRRADNIPPGTAAYVCGFATSAEVDSAPTKDFGSKIGTRGGYYCHYICLHDLHNICFLRDWLDHGLMPADA